ncbi:salivary peroxidase/catechol oxidase-like [Rhipicephalus microplus]|uniref:salivary peroxidase/catechol oxidase-like n=1 Tax=Rhipicephalus microplus TaxID=6941 RepID=UPI003F6BC365
MLFRLPENPFGLDLFAIDIERGRDHGTASYAAYVQRLFGITLSSFDDLYLRNLMPREVAMLYADLYEDVQDIDLFTAGMNEPALPGGDVGRTFAAIIAEEFRRLKLGDRFYYEHGDQAGSFSEDQLNSIRNITYAKVLCQNSQGINNIQKRAFLLPGVKNPVVTCAELPQLNLNLWQGPRSRR